MCAGVSDDALNLENQEFNVSSLSLGHAFELHFNETVQGDTRRYRDNPAYITLCWCATPAHVPSFSGILAFAARHAVVHSHSNQYGRIRSDRPRHAALGRGVFIRNSLWVLSASHQKLRSFQMPSCPFISEKCLHGDRRTFPSSVVSFGMEAVVPLVSLDYNTYSNDPGRGEPVFARFPTTTEGDYTMATIHEKSGCPIRTLYSWREQGRANPEWRAPTEHFAFHLSPGRMM
jgi:hypothetical protein